MGKRKYEPSDEDEEPSEEPQVSQPSSSDLDEDDSDEPSHGGDGEQTLEEQVADIPFEVLEKLRQDGQGLVGKAARVAAMVANQQTFKRAHKDRPQELSSKRAVGRFREVIQVPNRVGRDPRFDDTVGRYDKDMFRKRYSFLYNDVLPGEKRQLQEQIKGQKNPRLKVQLQGDLNQVEQQLRDEDMRRRATKLETEFKAQERSAVAGGKKPYHLKASERKRLGLMAKYQELQERGKLDKFLEKRRKKNAAKDHRYLPSMRRPQQE